jgi:hypothetical protein
VARPPLLDFWKACYLGECNSSGLEQKKGCCKDPSGTFFIDTDAVRMIHPDQDNAQSDYILKLP